VKIQIRVLMQLECAGHLFLVAKVLDRLHRNGMMRELRRAFIGQNPVLNRGDDVRHRHDAVEFGNASIHLCAAGCLESSFVRTR